MEKTRSLKVEMDGDVFTSHQSRHSSFIVNMIKVLFPICTLIWRLKNYGSRHGTVKNGETKVLIILYNFVALGTVINFFEER